jgi:hypothetical protein
MFGRCPKSSFTEECRLSGGVVVRPVVDCDVFIFAQQGRAVRGGVWGYFRGLPQMIFFLAHRQLHPFTELSFPEIVCAELLFFFCHLGAWVGSSPKKHAIVLI